MSPSDNHLWALLLAQQREDYGDIFLMRLFSALTWYMVMDGRCSPKKTKLASSEDHFVYVMLYRRGNQLIVKIFTRDKAPLVYAILPNIPSSCSSSSNFNNGDTTLDSMLISDPGQSMRFLHPRGVSISFSSILWHDEFTLDCSLSSLTDVGIDRYLPFLPRDSLTILEKLVTLMKSCRL